MKFIAESSDLGHAWHALRGSIDPHNKAQLHRSRGLSRGVWYDIINGGERAHMQGDSALFMLGTSFCAALTRTLNLRGIGRVVHNIQKMDGTYQFRWAYGCARAYVHSDLIYNSW